MWSRHAAVVVASNLLAAGLLLAALVYCWPRGTPARNHPHHLTLRRTELVNCARACVKNEPPRECYYEFVIRPEVILDLSCEDAGLNTSGCITSNAAVASSTMVFAINGQVPGPPIQVCSGDVVVVDVWNRLPGQQVSLHWHGLRQRGTPHMDGVPMVTQCPVPASSRFRYVFRAADPGTHLYRAHAVSQHAVGLFGAIIVRQPRQDDLHASLHDFDLQEHTLLLSTWPRAADNGGHSTIVISGKAAKRGLATDTQLVVLPGRRYKLRVVSASAGDCPMLLRFDQHTLLVVAKDGGPTEPLPVAQLPVLPGERYEVVLKANQTSSSYKLRVKGYQSCLGYYGEADLIYQPINRNQEVEVKVQASTDEEAKRNFLQETCLDFLECYPLLKGLSTTDPEPEQPDLRFYLPFDVNPVEDFDGQVDFRYLHEGVPYYPAYLSVGSRPVRLPQFSNVSFLYPASPLLSQLQDVDGDVLCREDASGQPLCPTHSRSGFCECTHVLRVPLNASLELVLVDLGGGGSRSRTFHLHGHRFRVLGWDTLGRTLAPGEVRNLDAGGGIRRDLAAAPAADTAAVPNKGYAVWRLRADNPGYWLLESRSGDVADDAGPQLVLRVGTEADIPAAPAGFPRCGTFKGPDFLFT